MAKICVINIYEKSQKSESIEFTEKKLSKKNRVIRVKIYVNNRDTQKQFRSHCNPSMKYEETNW